jgi:hypothetical protein
MILQKRNGPCLKYSQDGDVILPMGEMRIEYNILA